MLKGAGRGGAVHGFALLLFCFCRFILTTEVGKKDLFPFILECLLHWQTLNIDSGLLLRLVRVLLITF